MRERRAQVLHLDLGINLRCGKVAVPHQVRDIGKGNPGHPKVRPEGVAEGMNGRRPGGDFGPPTDRFDLLQEVGFPPARAGGDDPAITLSLAALLLQGVAQEIRERDHPLVGLRAPVGFLLDHDDPRVEADIAPFEVLKLSPAHAGEEEDGEDPPLFRGRGAKESGEFLRGHELGDCPLGEVEPFDVLHGVRKKVVSLDGEAEEGAEALDLVVNRSGRDLTLQRPASQGAEGAAIGARRSSFSHSLPKGALPKGYLFEALQ